MDREWGRVNENWVLLRKYLLRVKKRCIKISMTLGMPLTDFYKELIEIFGEKFSIKVPDSKHLIPDLICQAVLMSTKHSFITTRILDWEAFEYDRVNWGNDEIKGLLFSKVNYRGIFSLITDEGIRDNKIFKFDFDEIDNFIEKYEDFYEMEFFQASDYVLFNHRTNLFTILTHNGTIIQEYKERQC